MEQPATPASVGKVIVPPQVWETLSLSQQTVVLQTVIRICQEIIDQWNQEERHEPVPER